MKSSFLVFVWPLGLALGILLGCCSHRLAGAPTKACAGGLPVLVEDETTDAGPDAGQE